MERNESSNGLQLIKIACLRLRGKFCTLFMGAFAMVVPLLLSIIVPLTLAFLLDTWWVFSIGVMLFAIFVGPLQVGYIKYYEAVMKGKPARLSIVYSEIRFSVKILKIIYISLLLFIMYIIGGMLWILPAGFAISFYSMSLFFFEKKKHERLTQAMKECATKMIGNRVTMFSYKLIFYFVYFLLFIVGLLCVGLTATLAADSMVIGWLIGVCCSVIFIFLYTMITVYFHSANEVFYEDILIIHDKKTRRKKEQLENKNNPKEIEKTKEKEQKEDKKENKESEDE